MVLAIIWFVTELVNLSHLACQIHNRFFFNLALAWHAWQILVHTIIRFDKSWFVTIIIWFATKMSQPLVFACGLTNV